MTTYRNVARYQLLGRLNLVTFPWAILALAFSVTLIIFGVIGSSPSAHPGSVGAIYVAFFICGILSIDRSLPFGLSLGLSRRSYYIGTALSAIAVAAVNGLALAALQAIERATGGWGESAHIFRVSYILVGPWYQTWLTAFVLLTLLFAYGMTFGLVHLKLGTSGLQLFIVGQLTVMLAATLIATGSHGWHHVGHFLTTLGATGLTGVLAAVAIALLAGGFALVRRVTV